MERYQLAKLVEWAGEVRTRKRLQKVIYLLKRAGCPLDARFILHHYGPYSFDVAQLTDEMTRSGLLHEESHENPAGSQFCYTIEEQFKERIAELSVPELDSFKSQAKRLFGESKLYKLELAATIAYFQEKKQDWDVAVDQTARFKDEERDSASMREALALAKDCVV